MDHSSKIFGNLLTIIIIKLAKWLRIDKKKTISEIVQSDLYYFNFFLFRIFIQQDEYEKHCITLTYQRIKYAIYITLNCLWVIIIMSIYLISTENKIIIDLKYIEEGLSIQRADIVIMCVISVFCISECEFIGLLSKVLKYRSGFHDFIHKYLNFNDQRLTSNDIHYLKQYHLSLKITGIIFTVLVIPGLSLVYLCEIGLVVWFYFKNIITSTQLILTTIMLVSSGFHIGFLITSLQISTLSAAFCTEFLKLRSRQSLKFLKSNHRPKRILIRKFQWNSFHREYVNLYQQTALLNKTISFQLYIGELGSKVSSITTCVFYSRQISMGISNTFIFGAMISVFVYITGLYTQLTYLPAYNQQCCRLLLEWIARQSIKNKTKKQRKMIYASIKSNLFTQTMNQNKFGFHCGQIFFITKFKVVELILMNIPLILLFYKKISKN